MHLVGFLCAKNLKINVNPEEHDGVRVCLLQTLIHRRDTQGKDQISLGISIMWVSERTWKTTKQSHR